MTWYLDDSTLIEDTLVVEKVLELIIEDGPCCRLHLNVDKTEIFWPKKDLRSRLEGVFPLNIARTFHDAKLLGGPASVDFNFSSELVMKRYIKTIFCYAHIFSTVLMIDNGDLLPYPLHLGDLASIVKVSLFSVSKPCSACSKVFTGDMYGDYVISAGKEVDIGLDGGCDNPLRPADMLLYSRDEGLDVCVDLTGSSPLTQTGMVDFVLGRVVIDAAHRKRVKYDAKCANIGYGFLPFSFSSLRELEKDAVTLLNRIRKYSVTQDIRARAAVHIFNMINFVIAKRCEAIGYGLLAFSFSSLGKLEGDAVTLLKRIRKFSMNQDIGARVALHIFNRISFVIDKGVEAQI
ncbi:hypothetical protein Tco_0797422, partial [Tanacetum coccineum]